ncbi:hypothetical protein D3C79_779770 [compost metagenome]
MRHLGAAEDRLDLVDVVADAGGNPHIRDRIAVARVACLQDLHQLRIEVMPARQLATVQLLDGTRLDQPRQEVVGRAHQVVATVAGHQLGFGGFIAIDQVVGGLDTRAPGELGQGVVGNVAAPVGNVDPFFGLHCRSQQGRGQQRHASVLDHGIALLFLFAR